MYRTQPTSAPRLLSAVLCLLLASGISPPNPDGGQRLRELKRQLEKTARDGDEEGGTAAIQEIAALGTKAAMETLLSAALTLKEGEIFESIPLALAGVTEGEGLQFLSKLLIRPKRAAGKLRSWKLRVLIAEAFGARKDEATLPPLTAGLSDSALPVRLSAVRALVKRGDRQAIPSLIELLESEEEDPGIVWQETLAALQSMSGAEIVAAVDWKNWWEAHAGDGPLPPAKEGEEEDDPEKTRTSSFFGVELISKRMVFLIDVSGSMRLSDRPPPGGEQPERSDPEGDEKWQKSRERIGRAKRELVSTLKDLRHGVRFNIVAFAETLKTFAPGRLIPARRGNKAKAIEFVQGLKTRGGTATGDALREGFRFDEADTIVLLSDGVPAKMEGEAPTADEIIAMVRRLNRLRKVQIHTFGFDGKGILPPGMPDHSAMSPGKLAEFRQMMMQLAEENHGRYTSIR